MDRQEYSTNGASLFDGTDRLSWILMMKAHLQTLGSYVFESVENGYTPPKSRTKGATTKRLHKIIQHQGMQF
jgi:hypothetical protein